MPEDVSAEKYEALRVKYQQEVTTNRKLTNDLGLGTREQKKLELQNEQQAALIAEMKKKLTRLNTLEDLCRKLQEYNKSLLEQNSQIAALEEAKRAAHVENVNKTISDVQVKITAMGEDNVKVVTENDMLRTRLKELGEAMDSVQRKYEETNKVKDLQLKLSQAETEKAVAERQHLEVQVKKLNEILQQSTSRDRDFIAKVEDIQKQQAKSAEVMKLYDETIKEKNKKITELLSSKAASDKAKAGMETQLLKSIQENKSLQDAQLRTTKQLQQALMLCKTLQTERKTLLEQVDRQQQQVQEQQPKLESVLAGGDGEAGDDGAADGGAPDENTGGGEAGASGAVSSAADESGGNDDRQAQEQSSDGGGGSNAGIIAASGGGPAGGKSGSSPQSSPNRSPPQARTPERDGNPMDDQAAGGADIGVVTSFQQSE